MPRRQEQNIKESSSQQELRYVPFGAVVQPRQSAYRSTSKNSSNEVCMKNYGQQGQSNAIFKGGRHHTFFKGQLNTICQANLDFKMGKRVDHNVYNNQNKSNISLGHDFSKYITKDQKKIYSQFNVFNQKTDPICQKKSEAELKGISTSRPQQKKIINTPNKYSNDMENCVKQRFPPKSAAKIDNYNQSGTQVTKPMNRSQFLTHGNKKNVNSLKPQPDETAKKTINWPILNEQVRERSNSRSAQRQGEYFTHVQKRRCTTPSSNMSLVLSHGFVNESQNGISTTRNSNLIGMSKAFAQIPDSNQSSLIQSKVARTTSQKELTRIKYKHGNSGIFNTTSVF